MYSINRWLISESRLGYRKGTHVLLSGDVYDFCYLHSQLPVPIALHCRTDPSRKGDYDAMVPDPEFSHLSDEIRIFLRYES